MTTVKLNRKSGLKSQYRRKKQSGFSRWLSGGNEFFDNEIVYPEQPQQQEVHIDPVEPDPRTIAKAQRVLGVAYKVVAGLVCFSIIAVLLVTVSFLPRFGEQDSPANNEVAQRYIEQGMEETGAVNIVAGMILDYRAFDTFGEACVLLCAVTCVFILLKNTSGEDHSDRIYEPKNDVILQRSAGMLSPFIIIFGFYIVLNGHISPGGGFSGGAVMGSGMVLYLLAFGFRRTERFFKESTYKVITVSALSFYCLAKSYSFFTGANHIPSGITTGTPGDIFSSGLILPLNICVGLVVACTIYAFYVMFRKGDF